MKCNKCKQAETQECCKCDVHFCMDCGYECNECENFYCYRDLKKCEQCGKTRCKTCQKPHEHKEWAAFIETKYGFEGPDV